MTINYGFFLLLGVILRVLDTMNITEVSNMTRNLCVVLNDINNGLERGVRVRFNFISTGYAMRCKSGGQAREGGEMKEGV